MASVCPSGRRRPAASRIPRCSRDPAHRSANPRSTESGIRGLPSSQEIFRPANRRSRPDHLRRCRRRAGAYRFLPPFPYRCRACPIRGSGRTPAWWHRSRCSRSGSRPPIRVPWTISAKRSSRCCRAIATTATAAAWTRARSPSIRRSPTPSWSAVPISGCPCSRTPAPA